MDYTSTPEQQAFREVVRKFAEREIAPVCQEFDEKAEFPPGLFEKAAELGFVGLSCPMEDGGMGLGVVEEAIFTEEVARVNPNICVGLILPGLLAPSLLWNFATAAQKQKYLTPVLQGKVMVALGVTEPTAGSDVLGLKTTARREGDEWVLNGEKCFITMGNYAAWTVVLAYTDRSKGADGMQFFIVENHWPGFTVQKMDMWTNRSAPTTQIFLNEVRVPEANRLSAGFREIMATFNRERILVAARWLGHADHAFEWALGYAKEREQFGKPIGHFQSIAFQLAEAKTMIEAARHLTYYAAWRWDQNVPIKELIMDASVAKLQSTQTAYQVTQTAVHIAGGWGLVKGVLPAMRMALDALTAPVTVGSFEIQKRIIARQLGLPCD